MNLIVFKVRQCVGMESLVKVAPFLCHIQKEKARMGEFLTLKNPRQHVSPAHWVLH